MQKVKIDIFTSPGSIQVMNYLHNYFFNGMFTQNKHNHVTIVVYIFGDWLYLVLHCDTDLYKCVIKVLVQHRPPEEPIRVLS